MSADLDVSAEWPADGWGMLLSAEKNNKHLHTICGDPPQSGRVSSPAWEIPKFNKLN